MKYPIQLTEITGQATTGGGRVICTLPAGFRYYNLQRVLTTPTATGIIDVNYATESYLKLGGVQQRGLTPLQLNALNSLNNPPSATFGTAAATPYSIYYPTAGAGNLLAYLEDYFAEPWNGQFDAMDRFALDIPDGQVATYETVAAAAAVAPLVSYRAIVEPLADIIRAGRPLNLSPRGISTLVKYSTGQETPSSAALDITKVNSSFSGQDVIQHIRLQNPTSRTIDSVQVLLNGREIFFRTKEENAKELRTMGLNPIYAAGATGFFDIVFNASGNPQDGIIVTSSDKLLLKLTFDASASAAVNYIVQHFGERN